jgi:hypothetical protein
VCGNMLFTHAILGCDTTSRIFGIGKGVALKQIRTSEHFRAQAQIFTQSNSSKEEIMAAGERAIVSLFSGLRGEGLDALRLQRFYQKVNVSTAYVQPQTLPPTAAAAQYHSMCVYYQVQ